MQASCWPHRSVGEEALPSPTPVRHRHVPENRDRGGCTPSPAWRLLARSTRGPAARSRPGGAGRYLHRGPGGRRRVRSPGECVGGGSGDPVAEGCTPLPKQTSSNVVVRQSGPVGAGRHVGFGMYYCLQADAIQQVRGRCRRSGTVAGPQSQTTLHMYIWDSVWLGFTIWRFLLPGAHPLPGPSRSSVT